jgi:hypothetical protein
MVRGAKIFGVLAAIGCLAGAPARAADSGWSFSTEDRDHPELRFARDGKSVFYVGCGHAFAVHAVYPGAPRKVDAKAAITVATPKARMEFRGEIGEAHDDDPPDTTHFLQWDLGYRRQDPALYGAGWKKLERRFLDLLDSGQPLTISAEGKSYTLPAPDAPKWKKQFTDRC